MMNLSKIRCPKCGGKVVIIPKIGAYECIKCYSAFDMAYYESLKHKEAKENGKIAEDEM